MVRALQHHCTPSEKTHCKPLPMYSNYIVIVSKLLTEQHEKWNLIFRPHGKAVGAAGVQHQLRFASWYICQTHYSCMFLSASRTAAKKKLPTTNNQPRSYCVRPHRKSCCSDTEFVQTHSHTFQICERRKLKKDLSSIRRICK